MKKLIIPIIITFLVFLSALPFLLGVLSSTDKLFYSGVGFNPIDGYSYMAKMQIGKSGEWLFSLPFSANPGDGRYLYPFYILAGHIVRITGISISTGYNLLRLFSYGCLVIILLQLSRLLEAFSKVPHGLRLIILSAGGGLGWLLLPFGKYGVDFWVSEAYPFLAGLANPHFPFAIGLMVLSVILWKKKDSRWKWVIYWGIAFLLVILSPFGFVMMSLVLIFDWFWGAAERRTPEILPILIFILGGLPYSIYQYWAVNSTPQLASWTAQNQTPAPAYWDVLISFSPWVIVLILGWRFLFQLRKNPLVRLLILWVFAGLVLTILPLDLQRRFMIGLYIPIVSLALIVLNDVATMLTISVKKLSIYLTAAVIPTTLFLIIMLVFSITSHNSIYYIQQDERSAIEWLANREDGRLLVLTGEQTGMFIPAYSRLRVIFGHPFETVNAESEKSQVAEFFSGNLSVAEEEGYLREKNIDWIFYGPREKESGYPSNFKVKIPDEVFGNVMLFHAAEWID